jgi:hypothetical protein
MIPFIIFKVKFHSVPKKFKQRTKPSPALVSGLGLRSPLEVFLRSQKTRAFSSPFLDFMMERNCGEKEHPHVWSDLFGAPVGRHLGSKRPLWTTDQKGKLSLVVQICSPSS